MTQMSRDDLDRDSANSQGAAADHRQNQRAAWSAAVARPRLDSAARLVVRETAEAADRNVRARKTAPEVAESCWLFTTIFTGVPSTLSSHELSTRDGDRLALALPERELACG